MIKVVWGLTEEQEKNLSDYQKEQFEKIHLEQKEKQNLLDAIDLDYYIYIMDFAPEFVVDIW